ncbi:exocyst complex component 8 [Holotrichia oblita]|uniref:Exocyst complex component 8 n=1 Tax=Holotrichia oblita TaxID=644536 RepID=A0ACB9TF68_HOLOL|nr:exocyst complex component 8 [Holotrichia oblita]
MGEPTLSLLGSSDFNPDKYVRELSLNFIGGLELARLRKKVHSLSEETSNNLKKNVYENYMQFIDTAKEISHLESEMYQLNHLLTEQKSLLNALYNTSILGDDSLVVVETDTSKDDSDEKKEEIRKQKLLALKEKVKGSSHLIDVPNRKLLYESYLTELDSIENTPLKSVYGVLFSDGILIANANFDDEESMSLQFEIYYDLGSVAVVNVRDLGNVKQAFKLLAFPDSRIFQCKSSAVKKEWLDKLDQAKKERLSQEQTKKDVTMIDKSPSRSSSIDVPYINPFEEIDEEISIHPEWFLEIPDELDVCIAQRHFEEALSLLDKAKDYTVAYIPTQNQDDHIFADISRKVQQRKSTLIDVLMKELEVNHDKSLQGGLRAARRAVRLLNQLDRSMQSCELFLKLCSSMLKIQCKRVKREGSTSTYVRHLSSVVFTNMCHMTEEFLRAFPDSPSCASAYVVWASHELNLFTSHFIKQAFVPQTSLSTLTECIILVRSQCERLCKYGIDICYQLDGSLRSPLTKALRDAKDKLIDSIKLRAQEDKWIPMNLKSKSALARLMQEYLDMGLLLNDYVTGDYWLQLTTNTVSFTKLFLKFLDDCLKLQTADLLHIIDETMYFVYEAQIKHVEYSLKNEKQLEQRQFMIKNADFLLNHLFNVVQKKYKDVNNFESPSLIKLKTENTAILKGITATARNITKYSSTEYL